MKKRKVSLVMALVCVLILSALPSTVFANGDNGAEAAASEPTTVTVAPKEENPDAAVTEASTTESVKPDSEKAEAETPKVVSSPLRTEDAAAPNVENRANAANEPNESVKATFKFRYGNKSDVVLDLNKGEALGDKYPKQETFTTSLAPEANYTAKLELAGFVTNGRLVKLEDMAKEVVNANVQYDAYYNVVAEYDLVVYDGRPLSYHMKEAEVTAKLSKEYGAKNPVTGENYYAAWTFVKGEEQDAKAGAVSKISRFQYKGVTKFPLRNVDGSLIKYQWANSNDPVSEPFYGYTTQGNCYENQIIACSNYFPWFGVIISDATAEKPVTVKITLHQKYPSAYTKKMHESTKTFTITAKDGEGEWIELSRREDAVLEGSDLWDSNGRIYSASYDRAPDLKDTNGYGTVEVTAEAPEMEGYTLVKKGDGFYKNDGKQNAFIFAYYKNMKLTFDAKAGNTVIKDGEKDQVEFDVIHKQKFDSAKVPAVKDIKDETFLGWADKDDADKKVVDFSNYTVEKDTVFVPVFKAHDTKNIDPIDPVKTKVIDPLKLTEQEKANVKKEVEKANKDNFPGGTLVYVGEDGTVTITYPDGSTDTITPDRTIEKIQTGGDANANKPAAKAKKTNRKNNPKAQPKTGDSSNVVLYGALLGMSALALAAFEAKRRKEEN